MTADENAQAWAAASTPFLDWLTGQIDAATEQVRATGDLRDVGRLEALEDVAHRLREGVEPTAPLACPTCGSAMISAKIAIPFPGQHPSEVAHIDGPPACGGCDRPR